MRRKDRSSPPVTTLPQGRSGEEVCRLGFDTGEAFTLEAIGPDLARVHVKWEKGIFGITRRVLRNRRWS